MRKAISENGYKLCKKSNVWKLYVSAGSIAGFINEQNWVEIPNKKISNSMFEHELEERCHEFGERVRRFCRKLKMDVANIEDVRQLVRASGSVDANYIEANENVGPGDLRFRMKISRKEAKESMHFLGLVEVFEVKEMEMERAALVNEASQLRKIFSAMLNKLKDNDK